MRAIVAEEMARFQGEDELPVDLLPQQEGAQAPCIDGELQGVCASPVAAPEQSVGDGGGDDNHDKGEAERKAELLFFQNIKPIAIGMCPLEWWEANSGKFPLLSKVGSSCAVQLRQLLNGYAEGD